MATLTLFYKKKDGSNIRVKYDNPKEYFYKFKSNSVGKRVARFSKWFKSEPEVLVAIKNFWICCDTITNPFIRHNSQSQTMERLFKLFGGVLESLKSIKDPNLIRRVKSSITSGVSNACSVFTGKTRYDFDQFEESFLDKDGVKLYIFKEPCKITHVVLYNGYASKRTSSNVKSFTRLDMLDYLASIEKMQYRMMSKCKDKISIDMLRYYNLTYLGIEERIDVVSTLDYYKLYDIVGNRMIDIRDGDVVVLPY